MDEVQDKIKDTSISDNSQINENHVDGLNLENVKEKSADDLKSNSDEEDKEDEWLDVLGSGQLLKKVGTLSWA